MRRTGVVCRKGGAGETNDVSPKRARRSRTRREHPGLRIYLDQEGYRILTEIDRLLEASKGLPRDHGQYGDTQDAYKLAADRGMSQAFDFVPGLEKAREYVAWKVRGSPRSTGRIEADIAHLREIDEYLAEVRNEIEARKRSMALDPFSQPELPNWLEMAPSSAEPARPLPTARGSIRRGSQVDSTDEPDHFEFDME